MTSQKPAPSAYDAPQDDDRPGVVRGAYQPVGKVDIAEIRRRAKESGEAKDDRPGTVKGFYEPVGKVDIAAIRARSQKPDEPASFPSRPEPVSPAATGGDDEAEPPRMSMSNRSAAFSQGPERLTSMPKPKVANKFGGGSTFTGTRAPVPGGFEAKPNPTAAPVGTASRTFADQGGKTPAQIWAEKKARERGVRWIWRRPADWRPHIANSNTDQWRRTVGERIYRQEMGIGHDSSHWSISNQQHWTAGHRRAAGRSSVIACRWSQFHSRPLQWSSSDGRTCCIL